MSTSTPAHSDAAATLRLAVAAVASDEPGPAPGPGAAAAPTWADDLPAVLERFEAPLLRYAMCLLATDHAAADCFADAQDIVQEALLRLHRHRTTKGVAPIEHLPTWLYRVTHHLALDLLRQRSTRRRFTLRLARHRRDTAHAPATPADAAARGEVGRLARATLAQLDPDHCSVLTLRVLGGLTIRQTAAELDLPVSTVTNRLTAALRELAARLQAKGLTAD